MSGIAIYSIKQYQAYYQKLEYEKQILPRDHLIGEYGCFLDKEGYVYSLLTKIADACLYLIGLLCCKKTPKTKDSQSSKIDSDTTYFFKLPTGNRKECQRGTRIPDRSTISIDLSSASQVEDLQSPELLSPKSTASS